MKEDIVDHVVFSVVMTGGEKMQDSGTQSENLQVNTDAVISWIRIKYPF